MLFINAHSLLRASFSKRCINYFSKIIITLLLLLLIFNVCTGMRKIDKVRLNMLYCKTLQKAMQIVAA